MHFRRDVQEFLKKFHSKCIHECKKSKKNQTVWRENAPKRSEQCFYVAAQRPYLTLAIDADIQRVSLASGAVDDCRRALCVEVVALCQAVQSAGLNATCFKENAHRRRRCLSPVWPAHRGTTTRRQQKGQDGDPGRLFYTKVKSECSGVKHSVLCCYSCCLSRVWTQLNRVVEASTSQKKRRKNIVSTVCILSILLVWEAVLLAAAVTFLLSYVILIQKERPQPTHGCEQC